jgi:hypothetical protein
MNYFFDCPYCSQSFEVEAELAGLNCVCTVCGEVFVVPTPPRDVAGDSPARLNDQEDMRPEVWVPEDEGGAVEHNLESGVYDSLAPQYAGDALLGDRVVPVNFVPTGMEPVSEVYGMTSEPDDEAPLSVAHPAEVTVKRVTPMMVQSSGASDTAALRGIIRDRRKDVPSTQEYLKTPKGASIKYLALGVSVGLLIGVMGMRVARWIRRGSLPAVPAEGGIMAGSQKSADEQTEGGRPASSSPAVATPFPDGFMGIKFGSKVEYIPDRVTWSKEGENLHKPATLADERVEAVLVPDHDGRLTVGAYVRLSDLPDNELVPFLEWALTVQDAITSKFGRPSSVHVVKNAGTETEIVRKIRSGQDFYECIWEDPFAQCLITLSVAGRSSRMVVFRLEYKSIPLTRSYLDRSMSR